MKGSNDFIWDDEQEVHGTPASARFESRNDEDINPAALKDDFSALLDCYFQEDFTTKNIQNLPSSNTRSPKITQGMAKETNTYTAPTSFQSQVKSTRSDLFSSRVINSPQTLSGLWSFLYSIHLHEQRVFKLLCNAPGIETQNERRSQAQSCMFEYQRLYPPLIRYLRDTTTMMIEWEKCLSECKKHMSTKTEDTFARIDDQARELIEWLDIIQQQVQAQRVEYEIIQRMVEEYPKSGGTVVHSFYSRPIGLASLSSQFDVPALSEDERKISAKEKESNNWNTNEDVMKPCPKTPPSTPQQLFQPQHYRTATMTPLLMIPSSPLPGGMQTQPIAEPQKKKRRKDANLPKRPLSAYNLFFCDQRHAMLQAIGDTVSSAVAQHDLSATTSTVSASAEARRPHRKTHGKISFQDLAKAIGQKWHELDPLTKSAYEQRAQIEKDTYFRVKHEMQQRREQDDHE